MSNPTDDLLLAQCNELCQARTESERRQRKREWIFTAAAMVVLTLFVLACYSRLRSNLTFDALAPQLATTASLLSPDLREALLEVGVEVMPIYAELGERKLRDAIPDVEQAVSREANEFLDSANDRIERDFHAALERSAQKLEARLQVEFPDLLTPEGLHVVETELNAMVADTNDLLDQFFERYSKDLHILYVTLEDFRPNRFERLEREELAAHYVHLWLTLLDHEIMGID